MEIEEKVSSLSAVSPAAGQEQPHESGTDGSQQELAEVLASKLELLKANLVSFQQQLQDRHGEERTMSNLARLVQVHSFIFILRN